MPHSGSSRFTLTMPFLKAGQIMAKAPQAMQLRYLTTLHTIGVDKNSTIVFPFPMELMRAFAPEKKGKA